LIVENRNAFSAIQFTERREPVGQVSSLSNETKKVKISFLIKTKIALDGKI
jgi:hypothetical protein